LKEREEERQTFIQEIAELNMKLEEKEKNCQNRIYEIENENQHSLDQKLAEFWNSAQDNEKKLISELQELDDKLKTFERTIIILKNELENKSYCFEKEKSEFIQVETQLKTKIKEKDNNDMKLHEEIRELKQKIQNLIEEINDKTQENNSLKNQTTKILKTNLNMKNQIIERDVKMRKLSELYENSNPLIRKDLLAVHKESDPKQSQISPVLLKNRTLTKENMENKVERKDTESKTLALNLSPAFIMKKSKMLDSTGLKKEKNDRIDENKERLSLSNFDDLESNSNSEEECGIEPSPDLKSSGEEKKNSIKKENVRLFRQNQQIMEKNELLMLFLKEKDEELTKFGGKIKNLQILNADYESEIKELRDELKNALDKLAENRSRSFTEKNSISTLNDEKENKIRNLEKDLVETKEKWANWVNFLNEELSLAEKTAVQAKVKYVEEASQKEFFQYKYNDLLSKVKKINHK